MKTHHLLTALLLAGTPCMAQQPPAPNTAISAPATDDAAIKEAGDIIIAICLQMEAVHDKESADALAVALEQAEQRAAELLSELESTENAQEILLDYLAQNGFSAERLDNAEKRLRDGRAFGSLTLGEFLDIPISEIMNLQPAPQELLSEVEKLITQTVSQIHPEIKGGPGTSEQTAWIMPASDEAVELQYDILRALGPEITTDCQHLICGDDGKRYDMHTLVIRTADDIYTAELWFDISDYWVKMTGELNQEDELDEEESTDPMEDEQILLEEAALIMKDVYDALCTVHDKESAEAAARVINILHARWEELMDYYGLDNCNIEDFFKALEEVGITQEMLDEVCNTLKEVDFYGSETLRNAGGFF